MAQCDFEVAWVGKCKDEGNPRCSTHTGLICASCGGSATHTCYETGQFVCGENLCDECEHTIFPSGTNGGIGFSGEPLPDGMGRHCKKAEQRFKPWYARDSETDTKDRGAPSER